jgi:hypothetical protein
MRTNDICLHAALRYLHRHMARLNYYRGINVNMGKALMSRFELFMLGACIGMIVADIIWLVILYI